MGGFFNANPGSLTIGSGTDPGDPNTYGYRFGSATLLRNSSLRNIDENYFQRGVKGKQKYYKLKQKLVSYFCGGGHSGPGLQ